MKRQLSKIVGICTAIMMVLGMSAKVSAANNALPPEKGTLTIHKYLMDDVSGAVTPGNGTELTPGSVPAGAKPMNGIKFDVYKVTVPAGGQVPTDGDYRVDSMAAATTLTSGTAPNEVVFPVSKVETVTTAGGTDAAPAGVATTGDLVQGFYLVIEQPDPRVTGPAAPFVVAVPMTNPDGTGWIQNVHVYPKNEDMSVTKTPSVTSVELGEKMGWTLRASIPDDIAAAKKYSVSDALDTALDYVAGSTHVTGLASKDAATGTDLTETTHWTAAVDPSNKLTVDFTPAGRTELAKYKFVKITFDTKVNASILDRTDHSVTNKADVSYTNRFDEGKDRGSNETKIHTASVAIQKVDANDGRGSKVAGAEFKIASSEDNAKAGNYLRKTTGGAVVDVGDTDYAAAADWLETTVAGATDSDPAVAKFEGIRDYTEGTTGGKTYLSYWLVETKAPTGYNLLAAPVKVSFTAASSTEGTAYTVTAAIKNTTGFTLPVTGGMGTILFTVGGIILIGIAAILIVSSRRHKNSTPDKR